MITQSRLTQLLQKRSRKPKKFARPTLPNQAERLYLGAMRNYAEVLIESMRQQLGYRKDSAHDWSTKQAQHRIPLDDVASLTLKHGQQQAKRVLGLADADMAVGHLISSWKERNIGLITGFTADMQAEARKLIDETRGQRVEDIADRIEGLFGTTRARAELIARDQTLKLNSQINQSACRSAGIEWYEWSTSRDKSVRDAHAELEGRRFRFDDPPVINKEGDRANPGEDYQCRCVPVPVVPELDEGQEQVAQEAQTIPAPPAWEQEAQTGDEMSDEEISAAVEAAFSGMKQKQQTANLLNNLVGLAVEEVVIKAPEVTYLEIETAVAEAITAAEKRKGKTLSSLARRRLREEVVEMVEGKVAEAEFLPEIAEALVEEQIVTEYLPDGTLVREAPYLPRATLNNPADAENIGAALRAASVEGAKPLPKRPPSKSLRAADQEYQLRQWSSESNSMVSTEIQDGISKFSYGYDYMIREYQGGASFEELVRREVDYRMSKNSLLDRVQVTETAKTKAREAMTAANAVERAFAVAEDSPFKTTYRGIGGLDDATLNKLLGSTELDMQGKVSSTSWSTEVAQRFAKSGIDKRGGGSGVVFELRRKSKGVGIENISQVREEHEVLVHGNSKWKIVSKKRLQDLGNLRKHEMWHLVLEEIL